MRVLFIGRFQPFHNGHLQVVSHLIGEGHRVIIAIGSAQYADNVQNPFTVKERREMIERALQGARLSVDRIVELQDKHNDDRWEAHVRELVPDSDAVFSNSDADRKILGDRGHELMMHKLFDRDNLEGTTIRRLMADGKEMEWKRRVPPEVASYIISIDGPARMRALFTRER